MPPGILEASHVRPLGNWKEMENPMSEVPIRRASKLMPPNADKEAEKMQHETRLQPSIMEGLHFLDKGMDTNRPKQYDPKKEKLM